MLQIDGSRGEGGGQILRSSLTLSMVTGTPVRISNIRARRARPGLMRQHLTAVQAAARISKARVEGAAVGAMELTFEPGAVVPGEYHFPVGTAGSTTLILQTVLPALLLAAAPSRLTLEGGTHNPLAPPFEFLDRAFLPLIRRMGPRVEATLERAGFYPAGGGRLSVAIAPTERLSGLELLDRGEIRSRRGAALLANLPDHIAEREVQQLVRQTGWDPGCFEVRRVDSAGPGNAVVLELASEAVTEVFTAFGAVGVAAEAVADQAVREMRRYLAAGVPVGEHLADQLLLPLALAGSGAYRTLPLSLHASTQIELIQLFLDVRIIAEPEEDGRLCKVRIES
ncbi:MAG TPA: RNA 3'-terminal phosphate cyclase [Thermoanaerobaculia bacterium]|jgi:RNA 3'-terminal phosphate cyclase (ATP)|nr:RNA 3'-terminal phosphate cyclase [Thermoanaerobaculia bacterium]